ncbi:MAG: penicillin acylase family protein [Chitinophagales bacterium]
MIKNILLILSLLLITIGFLIRDYLPSLNEFQEDGTLIIDVFEEDVIIKRDENGIPYVFANSLADVIRGQGFVAAQDRLFQITLYQKVIAGRLSSVIGEAGYESDIEMKILDIAGNAKRHAPYLDEESRNYLQWYADGFNAYLKNCEDEFPFELQLLELEPEPFTVKSILSILHFVGFTHGQNYRDEIMGLNLAAELGAAKATKLRPLNINPDRKNPINQVMDSLLGMSNVKIPNVKASNIKIPLLGGVRGGFGAPTSLPYTGSNNWTTNAEHSQNGAPIVSNDPHLDARILPGTWHPVGLFCPQGKAIGGAIPGIPGILTGRTEHLAFGITNAYGDSQDLFIEEVDPNNSANYMDNGESIPFEVREIAITTKGKNASSQIKLQVRYTKRGPIISDFKEFGITTEQPISLQWSLANITSPAIGINHLLTAKNVYEMDSLVAAKIDVMYFNLVFADTKGNIGHRSTGQIPIRANYNGATAQTADSLHNWKGFIPKTEMPGQINPAKGWLGTSNHDVVPDDYPYYYSAHFSPNYRYLRQKELMESKPQLSPEDHWSFILDVTNLHAKRFAPLFAKILLKENETKEMGLLLQNWDYKDEISSTAATVFHVLHEELARFVFGDDMSPELLDKYLNMRYYWLQRSDEIIEKGEEEWLDIQTTETAEDLDKLLVMAAKASKERLTQLFGENRNDWTWGKMHPITFVSPLRQKGFGRDWVGGGVHPANGSGETLNRGQYDLKGEKYESQWFSSMRMVADLSDAEKIRAVVSGGNVARQFHPYFESQLDAWLSGEWLYWWFDEAKIEEHTVHELVLKPF